MGKFPIWAALALAAGLVIAGAPATAGQPAMPPPGCPGGIATAMTKVNDYWQAHNPNPKGVAWTTGAYFAGDLAAAQSLPDQQYLTYAQHWATAQKFALKNGPTDTNPNDQAVGQSYIALYQADPRHPASDIAQIESSVRTVLASSGNADWWWIDALFMAMPNYAQLGVLENNQADFAKMYAEFAHTQQGLFNPAKGLWWRDSTFAGQNVYWSRGNGWVLAALARVLSVLPATDPHRADYVRTMQQMAAALKAAQQPSGFWYVNLGDPTDHPGPETSGTAFFTYGLAWGIDNGILDPATYTPVVLSGWQALVKTSVQSSGLLGYVQGPGSGPSDGQPVTASSTQSYGVGAFLLAGSELLRMCGSTSPVTEK
ncbi:MAG TPA: glycoside hydrolase family 88 protein [Pseudonocardiaceae bacterium]|jgi:rhamnogalacturonyl hydrolase YesR